MCVCVPQRVTASQPSLFQPVASGAVNRWQEGEGIYARLMAGYALSSRIGYSQSHSQLRWPERWGAQLRDITDGSA